MSYRECIYDEKLNLTVFAKSRGCAPPNLHVASPWRASTRDTLCLAGQLTRNFLTPPARASPCPAALLGSPRAHAADPPPPWPAHRSTLHSHATDATGAAEPPSFSIKSPASPRRPAPNSARSLLHRVLFLLDRASRRVAFRLGTARPRAVRPQWRPHCSPSPTPAPSSAAPPRAVSGLLLNRPSVP